MTSDDEFAAAGLLNTPTDGPDRLALLHWLAELGFTIDEMVEADAAASLSSLAGDRRMVPVASITRSEAARLTGLDAPEIDAIATAFAFAPIAGSPPGEIGFTPAEVEVFRAIQTLSVIFTPEEARGFMRVVGSAMSRVA